MARRLVVVRRSGGLDSFAWVLLGFVLGAGLAVFALLHAEFLGRPTPELSDAPLPPPATVTIRQTAPPDIAPPPAVSQASPPLASPEPPPPAVLPPAAPAGPAASVAPASTAPTRVLSGSRSPRPAEAPRPTPTAAADRQVADDAAAAGLTSRASHNDLY